MLPKTGSRRAQHGYKPAKVCSSWDPLGCVHHQSGSSFLTSNYQCHLPASDCKHPSWLSTKSRCSMLGSCHCCDGTSQSQLTTCSSPPPILAKQQKAQARQTRLQMFENEAPRDGNILILVAGTTSTRAEEVKATMAVKLEEIMRAFDQVEFVGRH